MKEIEELKQLVYEKGPQTLTSFINNCIKVEII